MTDSPLIPAAALPEFEPVPRKNTVSHGWTVAKQRDFIASLAATGSVRLATEAVGMSHCGVYRLRTAPGGASFARAWDIAVSMGAARVRDVLIDQAVNGVPRAIVHGGAIVGEERRFNHRTMMWVLQHHMPDAYPGGSTLRRRAPERPAPTSEFDRSIPESEWSPARRAHEWAELKEMLVRFAKRPPEDC